MSVIRIAAAASACLIMLGSCGGGKAAEASAAPAGRSAAEVVFDADSAYSYVARQVEFGPRVPGTDAHRLAGEWLSSELARHGAEVALQQAEVTAFDGTRLTAVNIIGSFNTGATDRLLLLAHYDCRPWADQDPDPARRSRPVDGANDGASGVGVLLEIARQLSADAPGRGVDILFVDVEDYGTDGDDKSWALGAQYFATHPFKEGYAPREAILLDMVGGKDASFCREYFSQQAAPALADRIWREAHAAGYGSYFINRMGGAITDDHVQLIDAGIPAIDIIDYRDSGFHPAWHTSADDMTVIDRETLKAVGQTVLNYIYSSGETSK